jgi:hypothetical protein
VSLKQRSCLTTLAFAAVAVLAVAAGCGGGAKQTRQPVSTLHKLGGIYESGTDSKSEPECPNQHLVANWTLVGQTRPRCAPSTDIQRVFHAYLRTANCLRRPRPNGTSCTADGYHCVTWNWQDFPGIRTLAQCIEARGRTASLFTAWSPEARD